MSDVEDIVVVHPSFAWLVDWSALAATGGRWHLVIGDESRARLDGDALAACSTVAVPPDFERETLLPIVQAALGGRDPRQVRIATMIEPVQRVVAELRDALGVPGPSAAEVEVFTDKLVMKRAMRGVADLLPRYVAFDRRAFEDDATAYVREVIRQIGLPVFAKPVAENSSFGTARLDGEGELGRFLRASPHELELDEHVEGDGFHLDAVVLGGRIHWFGAGRYLVPQAQTLSGGPLAGWTVDPESALFEELRALHERILGSFPRVPDGCTHTEVLRRPDGRYAFLETAARVPGARHAEQYELLYGINLRRIHYEIQAGRTPSLAMRRGPHAGYYCPLKVEPGRIRTVHQPPFRSQHSGEWSEAWLARTDVATSMSMANCLGVFVLWSDDHDVLRRDVEALLSFRPYEIE